MKILVACSAEVISRPGKPCRWPARVMVDGRWLCKFHDPSGSAAASHTRRPSLAIRLWSRVTILSPDECWPWQGATTTAGYGAISINDKAETTHRAAWIVTNGVIPRGLHVCHTCDNRICCNPAHLFLGTAKDNIQDMIRKGRRSPLTGSRGEAVHGAKLTEADVRAIRVSTELAVDIAPRFGVKPGMIRAIRARRYWKHVA